MVSRRPNQKETKWRESILELINNNKNEDTCNPEILSISQYTKAYSKLKDETYKPRSLTIGPCFKSLEVEDIIKCKAKYIKRFMNKEGIPSIQQLIERFKFDKEPTLTTHYADISDEYEDPAWLQLVITIDTVFLLEQLKRR